MRPRRRPPSQARRATGLGQCGTHPVASIWNALISTQDHPPPRHQRRGKIFRAPDAGQLQDEVRRQDAGGDGQKARGRPHRGRVGITARLRRLVRRRQADDRPVAGPRRLLLPRSRPRMHALDRAQNHFHGAFDDLCRSPDSLVDLDAGIGSTRPSPWGRGRRDPRVPPHVVHRARELRGVRSRRLRRCDS